MADEKQVAMMRQSVDNWNAWKLETGEPGDLAGADFTGCDLNHAHLFESDMKNVKLMNAQVSLAFFGDADLVHADFRGATIVASHFGQTDLRGANFQGAELTGSIFNNSKLDRANFENAILAETNFSNVDLSKVQGLDGCRHDGPSIVDFRTLQKSGPLPLVFLRGVGFSDAFIDYLPSLVNQAIQMYSCFISYSHKDDDFAQQLHADLQSSGVRCWYAPHDMKIGARIWDSIDEAIRLREKLLLILSEHSIASDWVEDEVNKAFAEERLRKQIVLFPIRIDDAIMATTKPWAAKLRNDRNIGNFRNWKHHDPYRKELERLLRDLKVEM